MADLNNYYGNSPASGLLSGLLQGSQIGMQVRQLQNQEEQQKRKNEWEQVQKSLELYKLAKSPVAKKYASQTLSKALTTAGMLPEGVNFMDDGSPEAKNFVQTTNDALKMFQGGHIDQNQAQDMVLTAIKTAKQEGDPTAPADTTKYLQESVKTPMAEGLLRSGPATSQGGLLSLPTSDPAYATPEAKQGIADYMKTQVVPQAAALSEPAVKEYDKNNKENVIQPSPDLKGFAEYSFGGDLKKAQDSLRTTQGKSAYMSFLKNKAETKSASFTINGLSDAENTALDQAIKNGLDPYKINSRTAKIYAQQEMKNPGRPWNALGAQASFERSSGTTQTQALLGTINPLLDKLEVAGKALGNTQSPGVNRAINWFKANVSGDPDLTAFQNLRDDTIAEVERGLLNTGVLSDSKYNRAIKNVSEASNYNQLKMAIKNVRLVVQARLESLAKGPSPEARNWQGGQTSTVSAPTSKSMTPEEEAAAYLKGK